MKTTPSTAVSLLVAAAATSTTTTVSGFVVHPQQQQPNHSRHVPATIGGTGTSGASTTATTIRPTTSTTTTTSLNGLFDGVKDAFSAPPSQLDSERETPIDRWMGWSVVSENAASNAAAQTVDFVDSMNEDNYVSVELTKPMGIVFEENDAEFGGIFVQSLKEDGAAATNGILQAGDQLVAVETKNVSGMDFDDALGAIIESEGETTKLTLFRGTASQFYGPTGPSKEWLANFCEKAGVAVQN